MLFLPISLGRVTTLFATGAVGALFTRARRWRRSERGGDAGKQHGSERAGPVAAAAAANRLPPPRTRVGRLRLPPEVANLTPREEPAIAAVNDFADRMAGLPLSAWLDAGRSAMAADSRVTSRSTSYAVLEATIKRRGLGIAAWYVRDAIETSAFHATRSTTRLSKTDRRAFAAAHAAAEETALSLLARASLPPQDFAILCTPFESLAAEAVRSAC